MAFLKSPWVIGLISGLMVMILATMNANISGEGLGTNTVGKLGGAVAGVVMTVLYLVQFLHKTNKDLQRGSSEGFEVDTKLPKF